VPNLCPGKTRFEAVDVIPEFPKSGELHRKHSVMSQKQKIMSVTISKSMNLEEIQKILGSLPGGKLLKASKYCGVLKLREDPLVYQKRVRDEWS